MPIITTEGIVVRAIDYSETSLILWLFTPDHGRLHVIAKGARRPRSPFEGACELLTRAEVLFYRKAKSEGLDTAKELDPIALHHGLRKDLARLHRGLHVAELLTELSEQEVASPRAYAAATTVLKALSEAELSTLDRHVLLFELELLAAGGLQPILDRCARCKGPLFDGEGERAWFSPGQGGAACAKHGDGEATTLEVSRATLRALLALQLGREGVPDAATTADLRRLMDGFVAYHVGKPLTMARHLTPVAPRTVVTRQPARTG